MAIAKGMIDSDGEIRIRQTAQKLLSEKWPLVVLKLGTPFEEIVEITAWCKTCTGSKYPFGTISPYTFEMDGDWYLKEFLVERRNRWILFLKNKELMSMFALKYSEHFDWTKNYD